MRPFDRQTHEKRGFDAHQTRHGSWCAFYGGWVLAIVMAALLVAGCANEQSSLPDLIQASDFVPREAELGERLEIVGQGFPEGRTARLTFRGSLFRPGLPPIHDFELSVRASAATHQSLATVLDEQLMERFVGPLDQAVHTTFRGEVEAAFAPRKMGSSPVVGSVGGVVLDLYPSLLAPEVVQNQERAGEEVLKFLGLEVKLAAVGLEVTSIEPHSPAAAAGLLKGDRIVEADGVSVRTPSDLAPARHFASLLVKRGALGEAFRARVDVQGLRPAAALDLLHASLIVGFAALLLLTLMGPLSRALLWFERQLLLRMARSDLPATRRWRRSVTGPLRYLLSHTGLGGQSPVWLLPLPYLFGVVVTSAFALIALGRAVVAPELDLGLLVLVSVTTLVSTGFVLDGLRRGRGYSLWRGMRGALSALLLQVPALTAVGCVVASAKSVRFTDIVEAQGAWPWQWYAFESVGLLLAFGLLLSSSVPRSIQPGRGGLDASLAVRVTPRTGAHALGFLSEWGQVLVLSHLAVVLFLGGWRVPGFSVADQALSQGALFLGVLTLELKSWGLLALIQGTRLVFVGLERDQVMRLWWRWLLPLSLVSVGATAAWVLVEGNPRFESFQEGVRLIIFGVCLVVVTWFCARLVGSLRRGTPQTALNPWL